MNEKEIENKIDNMLEISATRKMIEDAETEFKMWLDDQNWLRVVDLAAYIDGMKQILIVFDKNYSEWALSRED